YRELRPAEARSPWPRAHALSGRTWPAHLQRGLAGGLGRLGAAPDHADQRIPPDACRPEGAQIPRSGDGEVLFRARIRQTRGFPHALKGTFRPGLDAPKATPV